MKAKGMPVWKTDPAKSPYNGRMREYDALVGEVQKERNAWRRAAFVAMGLVAAAVGGIGYVGSLPKVVPHVIEVASWGEARHIGAVGKNAYGGISRSDRSIEYYLRLFVKNTRSISTDQEIIKTNLTDAFRSVTRSGYNQLQKDVAAAGMFTRARNGRVEVRVHNVFLITSSSYQIDWSETAYTKSGGQRGGAQYRGIFNVVLAEPTDEQINANPLGIFIDGYDIEKLESER